MNTSPVCLASQFCAGNVRTLKLRSNSKSVETTRDAAGDGPLNHRTVVSKALLRRLTHLQFQHASSRVRTGPLEGGFIKEVARSLGRLRVIDGTSSSNDSATA